jgi:hypothetical protein
MLMHTALRAVRLARCSSLIQVRKLHRHHPSRQRQQQHLEQCYRRPTQQELHQQQQQRLAWQRHCLRHSCRL